MSLGEDTRLRGEIVGLFCLAGETDSCTLFIHAWCHYFTTTPPSRMEVVVTRYRENNNYHLWALCYFERIVRFAAPSGAICIQITFKLPLELFLDCKG